MPSIICLFVIKLLNNLTHKESFIFKLAQNNITSKELLYFIPIVILSIIIGLSYNYIGHGKNIFIKKTKLSLNPFIAAVIYWIYFSNFRSIFPYTLFSGEHALKEIVNNYGELGAACMTLVLS